MVSQYITGGLLVAVLVAGAGGYAYFKWSQHRIDQLVAEAQAYQLRDVEQKETIRSLEEEIKKQQEANTRLIAANGEIEAEMNRYLSILKRHDLTRLSAAKPGLIERRVNAGTKDVFNSIENASRAVDALDDGVQLVPAARSSDSN